MAKDQDLETWSLFMTKHICEYRAKQTLLWHFPQQCLPVKGTRFEACLVTPPLHTGAAGALSPSTRLSAACARESYRLPLSAYPRNKRLETAPGSGE